MAALLVCWKCGPSLETRLLPLSRSHECRTCRAELHICPRCCSYDTTKSMRCAEPVAEQARERTYDPSVNRWGHLERHLKPLGRILEDAGIAIE